MIQIADPLNIDMGKMPLKAMKMKKIQHLLCVKDCNVSHITGSNLGSSLTVPATLCNRQ